MTHPLASFGRYPQKPLLLVVATAAGLLACATYEDLRPILGEAATGGSAGSSSLEAGGADAAGGLGGSVGKAGSPAVGKGGGGSAGTNAVGGSSGGKGGAAGAAGNCAAAGASCSDDCPNDPLKTGPGECGCGVPDVDTLSAAGCLGLRAALVHRYGFDGNADDSVGTAHGTLMGGSISGSAVNLAGGDTGQHVDLPNGIVSSLTNATFEAWVTWTSSSENTWQRVFDFGSSDQAEGSAGVGSKYIFLSPSQQFRAAYTSATPRNEVIVDAPGTCPANVPTHLAVVVDSALSRLVLYVNGAAQGASDLALPLSAIDDVNNWLGRSQYAGDAGFGGKISEFRIYAAALSELQVKASFELGEAATSIDP